MRLFLSLYFILSLLLIGCVQSKQTFILNGGHIYFNGDRLELTNTSEEEIVIENVIHYNKYKHTDLNSYRISPHRTKVIRAPGIIYKIELRVCKGGICLTGTI
jgi:hypothetical protein